MRTVVPMCERRRLVYPSCTVWVFKPRTTCVDAETLKRIPTGRAMMVFVEGFATGVAGARIKSEVLLMIVIRNLQNNVDCPLAMLQ